MYHWPVSTICAEDIKEFVVESPYSYYATNEQNENCFGLDSPVKQKLKSRLLTSTLFKECKNDEVSKETVSEDRGLNGAL